MERRVTMEYSLLLVPAIILVVGLLFNKYPPKKINFFVGYRTCKSMKDSETWKFANKYSAKILIRQGLILLIISIALLILMCFDMIKCSEDVLAILIILQAFSLILPIIIVENKIKNNKR